jgi:uncharacterized protein YkwD
LLTALVLFAAFILAIPYLPIALKGGSAILSQLLPSTSSSSQVTSQPGSNITDHSYSPAIQNGTANIQYPSDYNTLAAYALKIINQDRANFSVAPVTLGSNKAGQQHADSMLRYGYFAHLDTQGFKPYMRYSLLGGKGADSENIAFISDYSAHYTTSTVEVAISTLEHDMMYNDSACCNNGHRENILTALHNKVSIGVAYSSTDVYFDEEFENDYVTLKFSVSSANYMTITGVPVTTSVTDRVNSVYVAFDPTPQAQTPAQLNAGPREYGPGTLIGGVLPPCNRALGSCQQFQAITVYADKWTFSSSEVNVAFPLQTFINQYHAGVYTVYLITGSDTNSAITTISVFVS